LVGHFLLVARALRFASALVLAVVLGVPGAAAQSGGSMFAPPALSAPSGAPPPEGAFTPPDLGTLIHPGTLAPPAGSPAQPEMPMVPSALGTLAVSARFDKNMPMIVSGLHWRIYADQPDQTGMFRLIREDRNPAPVFTLPPGGYVVNVSIGLAAATKRIQLRTTDTVREVFDIVAGGARFEGRVGDTKVAAGQISFDVFRGSQFDGREKHAVAADVATGDLVLLPEGTYHVVSNYGDGNAVMRYDFQVKPGKLTDARINHRAAAITLKLLGERGGEALANTAWSVLTPGGDVIKESIGAFPVVVLAEGDYVAIARNEGKVYNRQFKVETGVDREIELLAR
jgi:hypothetical protein